MTDKESKDYIEGLKAGVKFTCDELIDTSHKFRRNILDLIKLKP